jgi:hypothetical protein
MAHWIDDPAGFALRLEELKSRHLLGACRIASAAYGGWPNQRINSAEAKLVTTPMIVATTTTPHIN